MSIEELLGKCSEAMQRNDRVQLVIPRQPKGERISLFGRGKPLGEICCVNHDGSTVAWFEPEEILMRLVKEGVIRLVKTEGTAATFEILDGGNGA